MAGSGSPGTVSRGRLAVLLDRGNRLVTRIALVLFRSVIDRRTWRRRERERRLRSIQATVTYPVYAARTLLLAVVVGLAAAGGWIRLAPVVSEAVFGGLAGGAVTWPAVWLGGGAVLAGAVGAGLAYGGRWWAIGVRARNRGVLIDESLPRTVAFVYALSRSGMVYPHILRTVAINRRYFGESAEEVAAVVKDVDFFGVDVSAGLRRIGQESPSEQFADFAENFANVIRSGRNVSRFLRLQYEQLQERRLDHQRRLLDLYAALGEAYVAVLVAGPLFLITILVIFGLLNGGTIGALQLVIYLMIPLANLGFIVYLGTISGPLSVDQRLPKAGRPAAGGVAAEGRPMAPDGGRPATLPANRRRLRLYNRLRRIRRIGSRPVAMLIRRPLTLVYLTGPLTVIGVGMIGWGLVRSHGLSVSWIDDLIVLAGLVLFGSFAIVQEVHDRRRRQVENAIPDLLDRLANANEAGMTFTEALRRVDRGDLGRLNVEVSRLISDITWGGRTERALYRFADRLRSPSVVRVVALVTNAMRASGRVGPVVRIAAEEAREDHRLRTKRREEMLMYTIIVYLAFVVFLLIALALRLVLIPAMPSAEALGSVAGQQPAGLAPAIDLAGAAARQGYLRLLFHGAIVQAVCSGFVAGQMGEGLVRNGAKHATVMVGVAYAVFVMV